jgi:hypothetical protein
MSSLPPSKRTPFAKINADAKSIIDTFSPSTYNIRVDVDSRYDDFAMWRTLYHHNVTGALLAPNEESPSPIYTPEQVRNSNSCIDGYWNTPVPMNVVMNLQGAPQSLIVQCQQFVDIDTNEEFPNDLLKNPNLDDTITRNYNATVVSAYGQMSIRLSPREWNRRGVMVFYDATEHELYLNFWWNLPCPLSFTKEWWDLAHDIMRKDASLLLAKFMTQVFSSFLPSAPLDSTNWKLSNSSSLKTSFWFNILERNKTDNEPTRAIIQIQNNRSTRLNKNMSVLTEQALKF